MRTTDWIGWYERGKKLGVAFTEIRTDQIDSTARILHLKMAQVLSEHVGPQLASQMTVSLWPAQELAVLQASASGAAAEPSS
ncbi:MAG TPA: hypothetical protein VG322_05435 [Candidatus Acidoferrales bacterium]|nr:hypothetical protein [Candidatus Acidoferrales bacterium]